MVKITSRKELEDWLQDKPNDWGQVIAARAALRVLPIALNDIPISTNSLYAFSLFAITAHSWIAHNIATHERPDFGRPNFIYADSAPDSVNAIYSVAFAMSHSINGSAAETATFAARAADGARAIDGAAIWQSIEEDATYLEQSNDKNASEYLTHEPLWFADLMPKEIRSQWLDVKFALEKLDANFIHWINWYERRMAGKDAAFDIPHDNERKEDKAVLIKLVNASNEGFWDKGAEYVNAQLGEWLHEARERAQERYNQEQRDKEAATETLEAELAPKIPNQNTNAITFQQNSSGKIAVDASAIPHALKMDDESRARYDLAVEEAQELVKKCATSNAGARLTKFLGHYVQNAGTSLEELQPSLFVQRGEKLRQEISAYDDPTNMLDPVKDDILNDLKNWQSAHNMMVALQPKLNDLDTAMLGPDRQPAPFTPDDLRTLASDADEAELLEDGTFEILSETASLADGITDPNDRRMKWTAETGKNLIIEAFNIASKHPRKSLLGIGVAGIAIADPADAISLAIPAAVFLLEHREWVENKMGNTPTWKSLFIELCDRYDRIRNFKHDKS